MSKNLPKYKIRRNAPIPSRKEGRKDRRLSGWMPVLKEMNTGDCLELGSKKDVHSFRAYAKKQGFRVITRQLRKALWGIWIEPVRTIKEKGIRRRKKTMEVHINGNGNTNGFTAPQSLNAANR